MRNLSKTSLDYFEFLPRENFQSREVLVQDKQTHYGYRDSHIKSLQGKVILSLGYRKYGQLFKEKRVPEKRIYYLLYQMSLIK